MLCEVWRPTVCMCCVCCGVESNEENNDRGLLLGFLASWLCFRVLGINSNSRGGVVGVLCRVN